MTNFLFWNLAGKDLTKRIRRIADCHQVDIVVLAESDSSDDDILLALNDKPQPDFYVAPGLACEKIRVFTRFDPSFLVLVHETDDLSIRMLSLPGAMDVLVAAVHMPSKREWDDKSQEFQCTALAQEIEYAENTVGHSRTLLLGDLNMNPFEPGMVAAAGLHGVMTRELAKRFSRRVKSRSYKFFYNPMWGFFGDKEDHPPGTHYYGKSVQKVFFWNIFDQVLVRPDLLSRFDVRSLAILDNDGIDTLVDRSGRPDKRKASDHLPIKFGLNLMMKGSIE